ncbi:MAG: adenylosuccinate synthase [Oscillospiraceae bacterium]|nr:adenylosuccinate synthase [Oscillospiraceae bacterium]
MVRVIAGAQWGDEGKGKIIDILASQADVVVRSQGGNNAGHTVVHGGNIYKLHLIPSGILYPDTLCLIGSGTVIDPKVILSEIDTLEASGINVSNLRIDKRAHVIMPYHIALDSLLESFRGKGDIGTTKRGIGPCYTDKTERCGIRICDILDANIFRAKLVDALKLKNEMLTKVFGSEPFDAEKIIEEYTIYARRLEKYVDDVSVLTYNAIKANKNVLFEGAQGTLLDLDMGTYPYVTSSHPLTGGACIGTGIGPTLIDSCLGIAKSYTTRVGKGPFPTELFDETGERIRQVGAEFGTTTGRPRRCGWMDTVILRHAVRVNGLTEIALNKLDTLTGIEQIKVCVSYERNGKNISDFPATIEELAECCPQYITLPGWNEEISGFASFDDLPENAKNYVLEIEKLAGCKISMVGVGPDRKQNLLR